MRNAPSSSVRRLVWQAIGLIAATAAAALLITATTVYAKPALSCANAAPKASPSERPGAGSALVPATPTGVVVCRYNGLPEPGSNVAGAVLLGASQLSASGAGTLAAQFDSLPAIPSGYTFACPADTGGAIVAYFTYSSGQDDPVTAPTSGCAFPTNGQLTRYGSSALSSRLDALTRGSAAFVRSHEGTIAGSVCIVGGIAGSPCWRPGFELTVQVKTATGDWTAQPAIRNGHFKALVVAGRDTVELIRNWASAHPHIVDTVRVTAAAGRTVHAQLQLSVK
jgi:hypothetical protein